MSPSWGEDIYGDADGNKEVLVLRNSVTWRCQGKQLGITPNWDRVTGEVIRPQKRQSWMIVEAVKWESKSQMTDDAELNDRR